MISQKETTLFEYLIAVIIIVVVGIAVIHPGVSSLYLVSY